MMPQAGTRVSLYFKGAEESSAIAVNCIRSGDGCTGANYRNKTLTTEHGMQLRLCECDMGVVTLSNEVKLDNLRGIHLKAGGKLNITASGDVSLEAPQVTIHGEKGVEAYEGPVIEIDEGVFDVDVRAKVVLSSGEGGVGDVDYRGAEKTYFLAWDSENLSDDSFRYRDAPEDGHYDWGGLIGNVTGGIAVGVGVGLCAYIGVGALAASSVKVASLMGTVDVTASSIGVSTAVMATGYTMSLAISDVMSGRVSSTEDYIRKALAGSVVGFLAGASPLARAGMGAGGSMAVGALEGAAGSAASQWIINGAIKLDQVIMDGAFSGLVELGMWNWRNAVKGTGQLGEDFIEIFAPDGKKYVDFDYLPGGEGFQISRRLTADEMTHLTREYGVEFAQVYHLGPGKNGGGGYYVLYSGDFKSVSIAPSMGADAILINHTHPRGSAYPSPQDMDLLKHLQELRSPQKTSEIIPIGKDGTVFFTQDGLK